MASRCCSCTRRFQRHAGGFGRPEDGGMSVSSPSLSTSSSGGLFYSPSCRSACVHRARTARSCPYPGERADASTIVASCAHNSRVGLVFAGLWCDQIRSDRPRAIARTARDTLSANEKSKADGPCSRIVVLFSDTARAHCRRVERNSFPRLGLQRPLHNEWSYDLFIT
jgi:hypothetical protein